MYLNYTYPVNLHTGKNPNLYPFKYNGSTEKQINLLNLEKKVTVYTAPETIGVLLCS